MGCLKLAGGSHEHSGLPTMDDVNLNSGEQQLIDNRCKAAAWAWYGHGGGKDDGGKNHPVTTSVQQRSSRFRMEAIEDKSRGKFHILVDSNRSNLLDAYELNSFSKSLDAALSGGAPDRSPKLRRSSSLSRALGKKKWRFVQLCAAVGRSLHFPLRGGKQISDYHTAAEGDEKHGLARKSRCF